MTTEILSLTNDDDHGWFDYQEFDGYYCECNEQPTIEELDTLKCAACGKPLI